MKVLERNPDGTTDVLLWGSNHAIMDFKITQTSLNAFSHKTINNDKPVVGKHGVAIRDKDVVVEDG